ncbi:MAG: hypothetical protein R6V02_06225 [Candidatus Aminicenantes bacterium]
MSIWLYAGIIIFALFIILLFVNPSLSCFGKRVKSPFYPLIRRRRLKKKAKVAQTEDYGFNLVKEEERKRSRIDKVEMKKSRSRKEKKLETEDYGFSLLDDEEEEKKEKNNSP